MAVEHPLTFFTPAQTADIAPHHGDDLGDLQGVVEIMRDVVNRFYGEVEREALPPAEGATVASETAALLGALPFHTSEFDETIYFGTNGRPGKAVYKSYTGSAFNVRFVSEQEWGSDDKPQPLLTFSTQVALDFPRDAIQEEPGMLETVVELRNARDRRDDEGVLISSVKSMMGVKGAAIRSKLLRGATRYAYDLDQQAEARSQMGAVLAEQLPSAELVSAKTHVSVPPELWLFTDISAVDLRMRRSYAGQAILEPTPPKLVIPGLRVVRALIERGNVV